MLDTSNANYVASWDCLTSHQVESCCGYVGLQQASSEGDHALLLWYAKFARFVRSPDADGVSLDTSSLLAWT
ncbi:hypothetical protein BAUCODRAFT_127432 [Baudoinia panamericana UAMH 10762]|uniref:Uncharacterized protein n=1 Tax=Baudoinia panamericana (strain UAMH 10762) TaxID=717646 RepID=M2MWF8_BAUPA|nr:uncharacterized protein BAUCODRAFT_127432 [Baudoinia panamericana UAMH 10762]EMC90919.1 hypothetical protein BAUCODRAFT_127432 [Baudoinia panamericana UAMH 10762]